MAVSAKVTDDFHRAALEHDPDPVRGGNLLGMDLRAAGKLEEAALCFQKVLAGKPDSASALNNIASIRIEQGRVKEGLALYRRALAQQPDNFILHGNLAFASCYDPDLTGEQILAEHRRWNQRFAVPLQKLQRPHGRTERPKRLKIGYLSSYLRANPVGTFLEPLLANLDRASFQTICYHTDGQTDGVTDRLRRLSDRWRAAPDDEPEAVAERIRADGVHILIDLDGMTAPTNLLTCALKPAPVVATWGGYFFSTGLDAMDALIVDRRHVPVAAEHLCSERIAELPDDYICYRPPPNAPAVGPLPSQITFGVFNNLSKINARGVGLWAEVLKAVAGSRLIIKTGALEDSVTRAGVEELCREAGMDMARVEFMGLTSQTEHLEAYNRISLALDTLPYSGGVTTLESLWMGVPVVTLPGEIYFARHSAAHLGVIGLDDLVAKSPEDYVSIATRLAQDTGALAELRRTLRFRMLDSPLCDAPLFARNMEGVYWGLWSRYLGGGGKNL